MIKQAVIWAGGKGERLRPLTDSIPKPMAPINDIPFLSYLLDELRRNGITHVVLLVGYKAEKIMDYYGNSFGPGTRIDYSVGAVEDLTGRRLVNAHALLDDQFLLLYGDNFWPVDLSNMVNFFTSKDVLATTTVFTNKNGTGEYGFENNTEVIDGLVARYDKSRQSEGLNGVDIGFFLVRKELVNANDDSNFSFEEVVLPQLCQDKKLGAYLTDEQYYYITDLDNVEKFSILAKDKQIPFIEN